MKVKLAKEGIAIRSPLNGSRMKYGEEYEVIDTAKFYLRRINEGDLIRVTEKPAPKPRQSRTPRATAETTTREED